MTLRTVTYDDATHVIVPIAAPVRAVVAIEREIDAQLAASGMDSTLMQRQDGEYVWDAAISSAPEYPSKDIDVSREMWEALDESPLDIALSVWSFVRKHKRKPTQQETKAMSAEKSGQQPQDQVKEAIKDAVKSSDE